MKTVLKSLTIFIFMLSMIESTNSQTLLPRDLVGVWKGTMTVNVQDQNQPPTPFSIKFVDNKKVILATTKTEETNYEATGNSVRIFSKSTMEEPIVLSNIQINRKGDSEDTLNATLLIPTDPPGVSNFISLKKHSIETPFEVIQNNDTCRTINVSNDIKTVLNKYGLACPISIPNSDSWIEHNTIKQAFAEILKNNNLPNDLKSLGKRFSIVVFGSDKKLKAEGLIKPVLQDPNQFDVKDCSVVDCMVVSLPIGSIREDFVKNDRINFDLLWQAVLTAPENVPNVRVDLATQKNQDGLKTIQTKFRRLDLKDGFIIGEKTEIQMIDPHRGTNSSGLAVQISVATRLCKRRISEYGCVKIEIINLVQGEHFMELRSRDIETPYMQAILNAIR